ASKPGQAVPNVATVDPQADIQLEMDSFDATQEGIWDLKGDVAISQGERKLKTKDATYDPQSQTFSTEHDVEYSDPTMKVEGTGGQFETEGSATFEGAEFQLLAHPARGAADKISANKDG